MGGAKGLKAELEKSTEEDPSANEALISAAKETVTKVINDAKQKVSDDEKGESTESKKNEVEKKKSTTDEHKAEQSLNWQDDKDRAKGLKTKLGENEQRTKDVTDQDDIDDKMTNFVGTIKIKIHQAKDLEKKDLVQKADPYVVVKFGSHESKSDKVKNSLTPVWNHETTLDLQKTSPRMIEIQLMDWERIGKDEPMGKVVLPVGEAVKKSSKGSFWLDLQDCTSGKILISTEFNGSEANNVVGGGAKELRGLLKSDSSKDPKPDKADVEAGSNQQCELAPQVASAVSRVEQTKEKTTNDQTKKSVAKKAGSTAEGEAAGITTEEADRIAAEKARNEAEAEATEKARIATENEAAEKARIAAEEEEARIAAERDTAEKARLAAEEEP